MTKRTIVAGVAAVAVAAVVGVTAIGMALSEPAATAATSSEECSGDCEGTGGNGQRHGGGAGQTHNSGGTHAVPDTSQPLTDEEADGLQYMREEEKLAHDVYTALAEQYELRVFSNIATSESRHTDAVKTFLDALGVSDPAADRAPGSFANADLAALYDDLMAQGNTSPADALRAGIAIEEQDIADLEERMAATERADLDALYANLLRGSENHLSAFTRQLAKIEG